MFKFKTKAARKPVDPAGRLLATEQYSPRKGGVTGGASDGNKKGKPAADADPRNDGQRA